MIRRVSRGARFLLMSIAWIAVCALLFFALRDVEDPSRRQDRILSADAGRIALRLLRDRDPRRFRDYHVVHVGWARAGEGGRERRWVVLADRVPHTALREAFVVELAADGKPLRIRKPVT